MDNKCRKDLKGHSVGGVNTPSSLLTLLSFPQGAVHSVIVGADGNTLISGSSDGRVLVWDANLNAKPSFTLNLPEGGVRSLHLSPAHKKLIIGTDRAQVPPTALAFDGAS